MEPEERETEFEQDRLKRIQRNQEVLNKIGVSSAVESLARAHPCPRKKKKRDKNSTKAEHDQNLRRSCRPGANKTRSKMSALKEELDEGSESEECESMDEWEDSESSEGESSDAEQEMVENSREEFTNSVLSLKEGGTSANPAARTSLRKKPKRTSDPSLSWPEPDAEEVKRAYLLFAKEGGGLMTMESVVNVASKLSMHLGADQVKAMEEYAVSKTSCHPRCLTLWEFRSLMKALLEPSNTQN